MDERILALLGTLAEIERELGPAVYHGAVERARLAVAAEVMIEAERRSLRHRDRPRSDGNVVVLRPGLVPAKDWPGPPQGSDSQS